MTYRRIRIARIGTNQTVCFAVRELVKYLKQMDPQLMVDLMIAPAYSAAAEGVLWVGRDPAWEKLLLPVADPKRDDGIYIKTQNNAGIITGVNDRSVLLAVYRFLQELGCVWTGPGAEGEHIPNRPVENAAVSVRENASLRYRGICIEGIASFENIYELVDFLPKVGMNAYFIQQVKPKHYMNYWYSHQFNPNLAPEPLTQTDVDQMYTAVEEEMALRGLDDQRVGHGWTCFPYGVDPMEEDPVFEELPQDFREDLAMIDGERKLFRSDLPVYSSLCYAKKSVRDKINDYVVDYCKANPTVTTLHFWLADMANNQCECEECQKKTASDWYVVLLNELDEKLTAANIDTKLVFLLYNDLLWAPQEEKINNPDRFILMFAPVSREYGKNYGEALEFNGKLPEYVRNKVELPASLAENVAHLRNWQAFFQGDSFMFEYYLMWAHAGDLGYEDVAKNIYEDIQFLGALGINGMVNVQLQRAAFPTNLPLYITAKALWNVNCDYDAEVARFYEAAFGADGAKVHDYLQEISRLGNLWYQTHSGAETPLYGPFFKDYDRLEKILKDFAPVIDARVAENGPHHNDWVLLQLHNHYVTQTVAAAKLAEAHKTEEAKAVFAELQKFVQDNELTLRKTYDIFLNYATLKQKLHLNQ